MVIYSKLRSKVKSCTASKDNTVARVEGKGEKVKAKVGIILTSKSR